MALPTLTPEQRRAALEKAASARQQRADVKARLKSSSISLTEVIESSAVDEVMAKLRVIDLLRAMPGVGTVRAHEIMSRIGIAESRRLRGLGAHQIAALIAEFAHPTVRPGRA